MSKIGKPTKLTSSLQHQIVDLLRRGNFIQTVCAYVGIDKTTYFYWIRRGSQATEGIHHDFKLAVEKAQAEAEMRLLKDISNAAMSDWMASAWKLERKFPNRFALRNCVSWKSD